MEHKAGYICRSFSLARLRRASFEAISRLLLRRVKYEKLKPLKDSPLLQSCVTAIGIYLSVIELINHGCYVNTEWIPAQTLPYAGAG